MQPTYEALVIDEELSPLQRVVRYSRSSIPLQRLVHVRMLSQTARLYGFDDACAHLFPILPDISEDEETVVRQALLEQIQDLAAFAVLPPHEEEGYAHVLHTFLHLVKMLLRDDAPKVRETAGITLAKLARLVRSGDLGHYVLTIVLQMSHDDEKEQNRMLALKLLNQLAPVLGSDLCSQFAIPELVCLAEDVDLRVRKAAAMHLASICAVSGEEETRARLLPAYVRLSQDDQYWVRKACADSLVELSKVLSAELRTGVLLPVFKDLARDESRSVQKAVLERVGPLIATLREGEVSPDIVAHYASMALDEEGTPNEDVQLRRRCAFNLPAVVLQVGQRRWRELRKIFHHLVRDPDTAVRRSLAFSLHELAMVLGTQLDTPDENGALEPGSPPQEWRPPPPQDRPPAPPTPPPLATARTVNGTTETALKGEASGPEDASEALEAAHVAEAPEQGHERRASAGVFGVFGAFGGSARDDSQRGAATLRLEDAELEEEAPLLPGGYALVEAELLEAFELFLRDVEEVKIGVVDRLSDFLGYLAPARRANFLSVLGDTLSCANRFNWRLRESLARQLSPLCDLFELAAVKDVLQPVVLLLMKDPVAHVRMEARRACSAVLEALREDAVGLGNVLAEVTALARADAFHHRQIFVYSFGDLASHCDATFLARHGLVLSFAPLAKDPVVSVRVAAARLLGGLPESVRALPEMKALEAELAQDDVEDVQHFARAARGEVVDGVPRAHPRPDPETVR